MLNQVFLAQFDFLVDTFWAMGKSQNALKMAALGPKVGEKCLKNVFFQK